MRTRGSVATADPQPPSRPCVPRVRLGPGAGRLRAWRRPRAAAGAGLYPAAPVARRGVLLGEGGAAENSFDLVNTTPRIADEAVRPDAEAWQAEAEAYVRERRGRLVIEADFTSVADFRLSASRFARAGYRIEVVVLAAGKPTPGRALWSGTPGPWSSTSSPPCRPRPPTHGPAERSATSRWPRQPTRTSPPSWCSTPSTRPWGVTAGHPGHWPPPGMAAARHRDRHAVTRKKLPAASAASRMRPNDSERPYEYRRCASHLRSSRRWAARPPPCCGSSMPPAPASLTSPKQQWCQRSANFDPQVGGGFQ